MFLCLPIVFGINESIKQDGDEVRQCLNCHNNSCVRVKRRKRFELFWIPLIPFKAKHAWMCGICKVSYADAPASAQHAAGAAHPHGQPVPGRGYDVGYQGQGAKV